MKKRILITIIGLIMLALTSCEKDPGCKWCTTVAILPEYGTIVGRGYACGQTLEIIQEKECVWTDPETGELYLVMTYCEDGPSPGE